MANNGNILKEDFVLNIMDIPWEERMKTAYETISGVNKEAYKDIFLISNLVLSKNPFNTDFLNRLLDNKIPEPHSIFTLVLKLLVYYLKSLIHLFLYVLKFVESGISFSKSPGFKKNKELILIDVFFINDRINKSGRFSDPFFPGLESVLKKRGEEYAYLPCFYNSVGNKKIFGLYKTLRILKKDGIPVLSEYRLLKTKDFLLLLHFILAYPWHLLRFLRKLREKKPEIKLLRHELLDGLGDVTFYNFSRYLQGKRIAELPCEKIKVISWYENQPLHKNLYKGLRTKGGKVSIYGAQLFLYSRDYLFVIPDENEESFGVIPDKIIANSDYFIPRKSRFKYISGPSLRYSKIFNTVIKRENRKNVLILLPYFDEDIKKILVIIRDANLSEDILIKTHPGRLSKEYKHLIPGRTRLTDENIYKLFESAKIVIGAASSSFIEAASLGIPVILIKNHIRFEYSNSLPEYGKGVIWEQAGTAQELIRQIRIFEQALENSPEEIDKVAGNYKKMFFNNVTEESIIEAFDLSKTQGSIQELSLNTKIPA